MAENTKKKLTITLIVSHGKKVLGNVEAEMNDQLLELREFNFQMTNKITSMGEKLILDIAKNLPKKNA